MPRSREAEGEPRRKSKRIKVMSDSGQTEAERRELRIKQRALKAKIIDERSELSEQIADVNSGKFQDTRNENNKLYENVNYTRESVLDSENIELLASRAARQADKLIETPRDQELEKIQMEVERQKNEVSKLKDESNDMEKKHSDQVKALQQELKHEQDRVERITTEKELKNENLVQERLQSEMMEVSGSGGKSPFHCLFLTQQTTY